MSDTPKPIDMIKLILDDYMERTPDDGWSEMIAEMFDDPVDIDRLRAAVVADSPELAAATAQIRVQGARGRRCTSCTTRRARFTGRHRFTVRPVLQ